MSSGTLWLPSSATVVARNLPPDLSDSTGILTSGVQVSDASTWAWPPMSNVVNVRTGAFVSQPPWAPW